MQSTTDTQNPGGRAPRCPSHLSVTLFSQKEETLGGGFDLKTNVEREVLAEEAWAGQGLRQQRLGYLSQQESKLKDPGEIRF